MKTIFLLFLMTIMASARSNETFPKDSDLATFIPSDSVFTSSSNYFLPAGIRKVTLELSSNTVFQECNLYAGSPKSYTRHFPINMELVVSSTNQRDGYYRVFFQELSEGTEPFLSCRLVESSRNGYQGPTIGELRASLYGVYDIEIADPVIMSN